MAERTRFGGDEGLLELGTGPVACEVSREQRQRIRTCRWRFRATASDVQLVIKNTPPSSFNSPATFSGYPSLNDLPSANFSSFKLIASYVPLSVIKSHFLALTPEASSSFGL